MISIGTGQYEGDIIIETDHYYARLEKKWNYTLHEFRRTRDSPNLVIREGLQLYLPSHTTLNNGTPWKTTPRMNHVEQEWGDAAIAVIRDNMVIITTTLGFPSHRQHSYGFGEVKWHLANEEYLSSEFRLWHNTVPMNVSRYVCCPTTMTTGIYRLDDGWHQKPVEHIGRNVGDKKTKPSAIGYSDGIETFAHKTDMHYTDWALWCSGSMHENIYYRIHDHNNIVAQTQYYAMRHEEMMRDV